MDPEDLLALLEGEEDLLTPRFEKVFAAAADATCPKCGDRMEVVSNGADLFKSAVALSYLTRCVGCGSEASPSGLAL